MNSTRMLLLFVCAGCTPLVGEWEGPLTCGDVDEVVSFDLAWVEGRYEGEGSAVYAGQADGADTSIQFDFDVSVDGTVGEGGSLYVDATSTRCVYRQGEDEVEFPCTDDVDQGNQFTWDFGDTIGVTGNCTGDLSRN